jgi:hypothetical protein
MRRLSREKRREAFLALEGDTRLERAYYVCPKSAGETLFPLDEKRGLRADSWSGGAARQSSPFFP